MSREPRTTGTHSSAGRMPAAMAATAPSCVRMPLQANTYRSLIYMAGQIPLDPPSMALIPGGVTAQLHRALASCEAVAVALRSSVLRACLGMTVYFASTLSGEGREEMRATLAHVLQVSDLRHNPRMHACTRPGVSYIPALTP